MRILLLVLLGTSMACSDDDSPADASTDASSGTDVGTDTVSPSDSGNDVSAGDDAGSDVGDDAASDAGEGACGEPMPIASVDELLALVPEAYGNEGVPSRRPTSGELVASGDFRISTSDFTLPSDCTGFCSMIWLTNEVPEVGLDGGSYDVPAGTRFRVRFALAEIPPLGQMATVRIQRSCATECRDFEARCFVDDGCYAAGPDTCQFCLGGEAQTCACVDPMQMRLPDGAMCNYITGDIGMSGLCEDGRCETGR